MIVFMILVLLFFQIVHADVMGRFAAVSGDVHVQSKILGKTVTPVLGEDVNEGDTLLLGASGSAKIIAYDENELNVLAATTLVLTKYDSDKHVVELNLQKGRARFVAHQQYDGTSSICEIKAPGATAKIKSADLLLETSAKSTRLVAFTGSADFSGSDGKSVAVAAGEASTVKGHGGASASARLDSGELARLDKESNVTQMAPTKPAAPTEKKSGKKKRGHQIDL